MATHQLSRATYDRLKAEFDDLTTRGRIDVAEKIERAREEGDLRENAGYHAAKDEQGHMEGRIRQLEHMLDHAEIVDDQFVYTILYEGDSPDMSERYVVGHMEEQIDGADVISASSPLGAALQGATAGQQVTYDAPNGALTVSVLKVEPLTEAGLDLHDDLTDLSFASVAAAPTSPYLPPGSELELPGLGTLFVRDIAGPEHAPTLVLLHGWTASADLNYFTCYRALAERYRVVAYDLRGHGRGLRTRRSFRLEDCADDAVAVADALGVDSFIPVGYSMGGPIAQLVWQRHRDRVDGLVLCATAPYFAGRRPERLSFIGITGLAALARVTPSQARGWITDQVYLQRRSQALSEWAVEQISSHDWRMVLEAGRAIGEFSSSDWISDVDVPTSVVVTMRDPVVPLRRQVKLFEWIPDAEAFRVDGAHDAVVADARRFVPQLLRAVDSVAARSHGAAHP